MTVDFYNIKQNKKSGDWQFKYKKKKNASLHHKQYETDVLAAFERDRTIRSADLDQSDKANKLYFADKSFQQLMNIRNSITPDQHQNPASIFTMDNLDVAEIIQNNKKYMDEEFADEAFVKIKTIYIGHAQQAYLEVANYIAETFFDNDIDLIKDKKTVTGKEKSFNQLCLKLKEADSSLPSKSWLYNAMGLFVDRHMLEAGDKEIFHTYGTLSPSHQVKLLTVEGDKKISLIKDIADKDYTVRQLQGCIDTIKGKPATVKTYIGELQGIRKDLTKRFKVIQELPDPDNGKVTLQDIEDFSKGMIEKVDRLISDIEG